MKLGFLQPWSARLGAALVAVAAAGLLLPPAFAEEAAPAAEIRVSMDPVAPIDPLLYGVNYVWHLVPAEDFRQFDAVMRDTAHYTLARYPGGWAAEWYDWQANLESGAKNPPEKPGIDPEAFLAAVPRASFVTPSEPAVRDAAQIDDIVRRTVGLVRRYGGRVKLWEIGNEWWLQRGGKNHPVVRAQNLEGYARLVAAAAPAMKAADPTIAVYATGDWTAPGEFATLRRLVGEAGWAAVDGISVHPYCGDYNPHLACSALGDRLGEIRRITGKDKLYASEWSLTWSRDSVIETGNYGIRNADQMVGLIRRLAFARVQEAAYWPPVAAVPDIAFTSKDYRRSFATGRLFGWMARYYRGQALPTSGDLPAAAAKSDAGVTLFVPAMDSGRRIVRVPLDGTGLSRIAAAEVMVAPDAESRERSRLVDIAPLPASVKEAGGRRWVEFELDPGTPGRGAGWEIARVTLQ